MKKLAEMTRKERTETTTGAQSAESEETMKAYTIKENPEKNGIEIYFTGKPAESIREALKAQRFRWHGVKKCWYGRSDRETLEKLLNGAEIEPQTEKATRAQKVQKIDLSGLTNNKKTCYGSEFAALLRAEFKRRGITGVTVRTNRAGYLDAFTFTIKLEADDFRSVDEVAARDGWGEFFNRQCYGVTVDGIRYHNMNRGCEDDRNKVITCGSAWDDESPDSNAHILRAFSRQRLQDFRPKYHQIGQKCEEIELTDKARERVSAVYAIVDSYNYDHSEIESDYFDRAIYDEYEFKKPADFIPREHMTAAELAKVKADKEAEKAAEAARLAEYERKQEEARKEAERRRIKEEADCETIAKKSEVVDLTEESAYFITDLVTGCGKECSIDEVRETIAEGYSHRNDARITRKVIFTDAEALRLFSSMLLYDFDFLAGMGGTSTQDSRVNAENLYKLNAEQREQIYFYCDSCVAVYLGDKLQFVIDPQGYNYARYTYIPTESTTEKPAEAVEETADTGKEKEPFYFPAPVLDQVAKLEEGQPVTIYQPDGCILNIMHQTSGILEAVEPGSWAQYSGVYLTIRNGRKSSRIFCRQDRETVIYNGDPLALPESVTYSSINRTPGAVSRMYRDNADQIRQIIKHYSERGRFPIFDTVQR